MAFVKSVGVSSRKGVHFPFWTKKSARHKNKACDIPPNDLSLYLVSSGLVVVLFEQVGDFVDVDGVVERGGVADLALVGSELALEALDQVTDGHTGGDGVRVDDDVGGDPLAAEDHVLLSVLDAAGSFLSVPGGELVTDLWNRRSG